MKRETLTIFGHEIECIIDDALPPDRVYVIARLTDEEREQVRGMTSEEMVRWLAEHRHVIATECGIPAERLRGTESEEG